MWGFYDEVLSILSNYERIPITIENVTCVFNWAIVRLATSITSSIVFWLPNSVDRLRACRVEWTDLELGARSTYIDESGVTNLERKLLS
jgi:hypothetical protein